ncbi:copper chaperone PCu(A)C [Acetobacter farinalis]|uniref:Copper chaperone PCu(A)C n=1 Tax=Acetobacter farinalis TaxID=1260984 RepID=A0ABT3Q569_9PROT|nr:copper chaperone PCu(A)C [Acetobacter farinalis]MCX2560440.1 copper chaperone PCu(A)C [Acetobacter farinalis]NHO29095.1 copper chaperone PCu(A)C [Acetobacter farinalis]
MKIRFRDGFVFALLAGAALSGPVLAEDHSSGNALPGQSDAQKDITITNASMQFIHGEGRMAAVYFTIKNDGENAHLITDVQSPACHTLVGHHSDQEGLPGLFTHLALPAHTTLVFPRGGYYLLCLDTNAADQPEQRVPFTFTFLGGSSKTVTIPIDQSHRAD